MLDESFRVVDTRGIDHQVNVLVAGGQFLDQCLDTDKIGQVDRVGYDLIFASNGSQLLACCFGFLRAVTHDHHRTTLLGDHLCGFQTDTARSTYHQKLATFELHDDVLCSFVYLLVGRLFLDLTSVKLPLIGEAGWKRIR
ncbi:hypothetical protein D3C79_853040 [compost metagenome]